MSATLTEVLMAQGAVALELEPDPDVYAELIQGPDGNKRDGRGLVIYHAEYPEPFGCIKVGDVPSMDAIVVNAVGLEWLLGNANGDIGPTDTDRVYVAGNNKLANPVFAYTFTEASTDDFGSPTTRVTADSWKLAEHTGWVVAPGSATVTDALRAALVDLDVDISLPSDILTSDESFEVAAGDQLRQIVTASRASGTIGRLRNRMVFDGHFRHPNLLAALSSWTIDPDTVSGDAHIFATGTKRVEIGPVTRETRLINTGWSDTSEFSGDVTIGTDITVGPCTQPQYLVDFDFESGALTGWTGDTTPDPGSGVAHFAAYTTIAGISPRSGSYLLGGVTSGAADTYANGYLVNNATATVKAGEKYALEGYIQPGPPGIIPVGSPPPRNFTECGIYLVPFALAGGSAYQPSSTVRAGDYYYGSALAGTWKYCRVEYTVGPLIAQLGAAAFISGDPATGASAGFDDITLTRIGGNTCQAAGTSFSVVAQDTYEITSQAFANTNMGGGQVVMAVTMTGAGKDPITVKSNPITPDNKTLTVMKATISPDDGYTDAYITFNGTDVVGDSVVCNFPVVVRTVGNTAKVTAPVIPVIPEESYTFHGRVVADAGVTQGTIGVSFLCKSTGRPDQVIDGPALEAGDITAQGLFFPFASPSGYDSVTPSFVGTDILGGKFTAYPATFSLTDPKRKAVDAASGAATGAQNTTLNFSAPIGAEHVHAELVAEDRADGFKVTSVSLKRAETPWTSGDVAKDLLKDPVTGTQLVQPGNIVGAENITFDWHVRRLTQRAKLQHLSRAGLAIPVREWRFYLDAVTNKPTMDWGTPAAIFADRTDLIFVNTGGSLKLMGPPTTEHSAESRVTDVTVVGADRERPDNTPLQITGDATNANSDFLDWNGHPLNRTQTVTDSSANHRDYAASLARYKADLAAVAPENIRLVVPDLRAWLEKGPAHAGDWVYVEDKEAGIEDRSNPMVDPETGATVFPKKLRIISRTRKLGDGDFKVFVHRPGQDDFEVTDFVRWETETSEELELGDPLPDFNPDDQGGPALDQLRRLRASMPKR